MLRVLRCVALSGFSWVVFRTISAGSIWRILPGRGASFSIPATPLFRCSFRLTLHRAWDCAELFQHRKPVEVYAFLGYFAIFDPSQRQAGYVDAPTGRSYALEFTFMCPGAGPLRDEPIPFRDSLLYFEFEVGEPSADFGYVAGDLLRAATGFRLIRIVPLGAFSIQSLGNFEVAGIPKLNHRIN